jgi:hypothetical protein
MSEPFDVYTDQFNMVVGAYGVTFLLQRSPAVPTPGQVANENVGVVRMSLEHSKVLAMILRRQLKQYERDAGFQIRVMPQVMNQLGLSEEDWNSL